MADLGIFKGGFLITQTKPQSGRWSEFVLLKKDLFFFFSFFHIFTFSVHISSASSMEVIKNKKKKGYK